MNPGGRTDDTLPKLLLAHATTRPRAVALRHKSRGLWSEVDWRGYADSVAALAHRLSADGVGPGDAVAILSDNRPEWLYADLAAQSLGARSAGVYQTNPVDDVAYVLAHSGASVVFCEDQEQVDKVVACAPATPSVRRVVVFDDRGTRGYADPRLVSYARYVDGPGPPAGWFEAAVAATDPHAPAMIVYTSGTTGPPKGALLTADNALSASRSLVPRLAVTERDQLLSYLPLCHVAEKIFSEFLPLSTGAVVHFGESIATVQSDLAEVSPTIFLGVPRIWEKLHAGVVLRMKDASWPARALFAWGARQRGPVGRALADLLVWRALHEHLGLRRCRLAVSGAAPISTEILRWFHQVGLEVVEGYGMTECAGVSHVNVPGRARIGTVGEGLPGFEFRLADDGEVLLRGAHVFAGYLHDPAATAAAVDPEGWLHTGDLGQIDDGYLSIVGRKKDLLITSGGKNLSPEKIENALKASPYVKEVVATGDGRHFVSALVQIDADAVGDWATRRRLPYGDYADLAGNPEVVALIEAEVERANRGLAQVEQVRRVRLLPRELHQDEGELTATQKVRRKGVLARWGGLVEEMYR
ncbi:MAG: long-chain fatty acid--CoA ligase [Myxococcota bacterium]